MLKKVRRVACWVLSFLIALSTVCLSPQSSASAAVGDTAAIDIEGDGHQICWGTDITYTLPNVGTFTMSTGSEFVRLVLDGQPAYCIQPGVHIYGSGVEFSSDVGSHYWYNMNFRIREAIGLVLLYGYGNIGFIHNDNGYVDIDEVYGYRATQVIIWELLVGFRDPYTFELLDNSFRHSMDVARDIGYPEMANVLWIYDNMALELTSHSTIPSFMGSKASSAPVQTLSYNTSTRLYEATLYDANGVLDATSLGSASGVSLIKDGNTLRITSDHPINGTTSIRCGRLMPISKNTGNDFMLWSGGDNVQECITGSSLPDPVPAILRLATQNAGTLQIVKTADDGAVSNKTFNISGNGINMDVATDGSGHSSKQLPPGTYTVRETNVASKYIAPAAQTVTVSSNATATLYFHNALQYGNIKIIKSSEDGVIANRQVRIFGTSNSGAKVDTTVKTGTDGTVTARNILPGTYTAREINTPSWYVQPPDQTVKVTSGATATVTVKNVLQRGSLYIYKVSEDKQVAGLKFRVYGTSLSGAAVDTILTTNSDGVASAANLLVGTYNVEEVSVPGKFITPQKQISTVAYGKNANLYFNNRLKRGDLVIRKTSEDGIVANRDFQITGKSLSGADIDLTVTTGADGTFTVPNILIGTYTVSEINTPDQYVQPASRTITVEYGKTATVSFNNTLKKGYVKFVKKCTYYNGYLSDAKYRIYKSDGTYTGIELTSDAAQWVYSPLLIYGDYYLQESGQPAYYAKDDTKYPFNITENGQVIPITANDTPLSDVYPEYVDPQATYRAGTTVVASYLIHSDSIAEHTTDRPLTVNFTAYYLDSSGSKVDVTTQQKQVVVPRFGENLTYFKVDIPSRADNISFKCTVETPDGVVETNTDNNTDTQQFDVAAKPDSQTPDTVFENTPAYFQKPSDTASVPTGNYAAVVNQSATWEQWEYEGGAFVKKTYGVILDTDQYISPDDKSLSHFYENERWHMKSGYGVSLTALSTVERYGAAALPDSTAYVLPQNGNAYLPEFGYELTYGKYRSLELTNANTMEFAPNPNTITKDGVADYRRINFTPLWYPDGNYTVKTYLYDAWCPAGMLSVANTPDPVIIGGNLYQDWYINHTDK